MSSIKGRVDKVEENIFPRHPTDLHGHNNIKDKKTERHRRLSVSFDVDLIQTIINSFLSPRL